MPVKTLLRGPPGHALLGSLPDFQRDQLGFYARCAREYGDVVLARFGPRRVVLIYHPDGPRQCIGNGIAMMEAVLLLATIAQRFRLAMVPGQRVTPTPYVTLRPEPGIRMQLARR